MFERFITYNYGSGHNFEFAVCNKLRGFGFTAKITGNDDKGVDIVAQANFIPGNPKFYIQCKYHNCSIGLAPIQEVYTGTHLRGNDGFPVVIANNTVTAEARKSAVKLGVEIIAEPEWRELQTASIEGEISNKTRGGLMGILLALTTFDHDYLLETATKMVTPIPSIDIDEKPDYNAKLDLHKQIVKEKFDEALICEQEAAQLEQKVSYLRQQSISLQKEATLANLEYG